MDEAMTVEELRHDEGLERHVERRACLLALKQIGVVTHLHTISQRECIKKNSQKGKNQGKNLHMLRFVFRLLIHCLIVHLKIQSF